MKDNKVTLLVFLSLLSCLALAGGLYWLSERVKEMQGQYDELEQRRVDLTEATASLMAQKKVFEDAFKDLENYQVNVASSEMAFYSEVQQAVQTNGVEILSTRQQGVDKEGLSTIAMTLRGDYYDMMQVLAAWRNLPMTVRVSTLSMRRTAQASGRDAAPAPTGRVDADMTVEAVIAK